LLFAPIAFRGCKVIESIKLKGWKTHLDSEFEFGRGTNVIVGCMGSGKSSIMEAICFALFGTFPSLNARKVSLEEMIMTKPQKAEEASVEMQFSYGGKHYRVERKIKRKGSSEAKIFCGGEILAGPKPRDVNAAVEKAIEISYNLFSRAVYSEQNEIDYFLRLGPSDRKAKFDELLDLEKYEKVRANAVTALNRLKALAKDKAAWIKEQKASLDREGEEKLLKRVREKEKENEKIAVEKERREKSLVEIEEKVGELEGEEKLFREQREKLSEKKATLQQVQKGLEETKKLAKGKKLEEIEGEEKNVFGKIKELEKALEKAREEEEKEARKKAEAGKAIALNERRAEELRKHLQELRGLGAECPLCKQELEAKTREQLLEETEKGAKRAGLELENVLKQEAEANKKLAKAKEEIEAGLKKRDCLNEERMGLKHLLEALEKAGEKEIGSKKLGKEIGELEKSLKESKFDEKALLLKRKQLVEEKGLIEGAKKEIESNTQLVNEIRARLEAIEKTGKQIAELEAKIQAIEESAEKMSYFVNSLLAAQKELREMLVATINQAMDDVWQRIYPYRDFVSAKMDVTEGSYELRVKERGGNWVRVEGILSGGERSAAAICIRIGFSLVLARNLSWLILDEPTHNLDSSAVEMLGKMMQTHLPSLVQQIFVITHEQRMKTAASASLYVLEREKNSDAATRPVLLEN